MIYFICLYLQHVGIENHYRQLKITFNDLVLVFCYVYTHPLHTLYFSIYVRFNKKRVLSKDVTCQLEHVHILVKLILT